MRQGREAGTWTNSLRRVILWKGRMRKEERGSPLHLGSSSSCGSAPERLPSPGWGHRQESRSLARGRRKLEGVPPHPQPPKNQTAHKHRKCVDFFPSLFFFF